MSDRVFICDVEPQGDGGWEIWISEEPYRGIDTDAALGQWDRQRIGGTWTDRRLVGRRMTRFLAERAARTAVRDAERCAAESEQRQEAWRANRERQPFRVMTTPAPRTPDTDPSKEAQ